MLCPAKVISITEMTFRVHYNAMPQNVHRTFYHFVDDAPQYKADTLKLFDEIRAGKFVPYTSEYVTEELEKTKDTVKKAKMIALISDYNIDVLPFNDEIARLAKIYVDNGIIPIKFPDDALHIAAATFYDMDYIVSLNFKHIVKHKTILETELINAKEGYKRVFIHTPAEVIENG
jgi:predicted nucleic acid-binding protein